MSTGNFENWAGNINEIGAIYPFVGFELLFWFIGIGLWILWHIFQCREENRKYKADLKKLGSADTIKQLLDSENPEQF